VRVLMSAILFYFIYIGCYYFLHLLCLFLCMCYSLCTLSTICSYWSVFVLADVYFIFHRVGLFVYFVYDLNNNNNRPLIAARWSGRAHTLPQRVKGELAVGAAKRILVDIIVICTGLIA